MSGLGGVLGAGGGLGSVLGSTIGRGSAAPSIGSIGSRSHSAVGSTSSSFGAPGGSSSDWNGAGRRDVGIADAFLKAPRPHVGAGMSDWRGVGGVGDMVGDMVETAMSASGSPAIGGRAGDAKISSDALELNGGGAPDVEPFDPDPRVDSLLDGLNLSKYRTNFLVSEIDMDGKRCVPCGPCGRNSYV